VKVLLIVCAVAAAAVYTAFVRALGRARKRLNGASRTIETSPGIVEYAQAGSGTPVLCIHGASGGFDQALDVTGALTGAGYRLIAPSRFGYLRSAMPPHLSHALQADAYAELLDGLAVDGTCVVGISAGAWSALTFALRYPRRCRALVLLVPANALPPGVAVHGGAITRAVLSSDFIAWCVLKLTPLFPGLLAEALLGTGSRLLRTAEASERARVREILDHLLPVSRRIDGMSFDIRAAAKPEAIAFENITCPVLAISAEDDAFGTAARAREIARAVPNGRAVIYPDGGHALVGRQAEALRAVTQFLNDALARG